MLARIETLEHFYSAILSTVPVRRKLVEQCLNGEPPAGHDTDALVHVRARLADIPGAPLHAVLELAGSGSIQIDITYETSELDRDIVFFHSGWDTLRESLLAAHPAAQKQLVQAVTSLRGITFQAMVTDRDGTVNNYCGRYLSAVQSAYNAVVLARFARRRTINTVILTSAPLRQPGLTDLSAIPSGEVILAGSKGRECIDRAGRYISLPINTTQQDALETLDGELRQMLQTPQYRVFSLIGSGVQRKFGQVTVARQDISGSIDAGRSLTFLAQVRALTQRVDPRGEFFRIEDTGLDIEIMLTTTDGAGARSEFDKGHGVRFLESELKLDFRAGACLVCGDTRSDVPMSVACASLAARTHALFVTQDESLRQLALRSHPECLFVDTPDTLLLILEELSR